ncbi:FGGY family carbohydrate kinase [Chitinophagaceae bacterium LB-8]|uniref:FGGY family carbohydrate kinase n=1 Tax=Paraflavisolibacter caeni TaxID=2982496 RepID=A0A9X3B7Y8_9BACT|nr:FGGY family carbohydrate kinase [Paraflavisolibacter caeni]MCU7549036.1 FGGY family carbohydrate kinase [Paraflavisolibacter caeni]
MLLLGIDVGTSSIKVSVVDAQTRQCVASAQYPETESDIKSLQPGWAEQAPQMWWEHTQQAFQKAKTKGNFDPKQIAAIGIAYQMHGLVVVDKDGEVLRDSIIWCDSRAVPYGEKAFQAIGCDTCLSSLLNSPGNFTAAKLAWVKDAEPQVYDRISKVMLPGDYIALKLTGEITTSASALSEGVFWDFQKDEVSRAVMSYFGFKDSFIPTVNPVFSEHGRLQKEVAQQLGLTEGIPVTYKAGDQPNNALSLNVLQPGEVAATAGTSGVIYGVSDQLTYDQQSRINTFAHVNHAPDQKRLGVLLCINGTGILNRWVRDVAAPGISYAVIDREAADIMPGSNGLTILPFGNGAERMLNNKIVGAQVKDIDLNIHTRAHIFRAAQEGIAFAFRYGLDIMRENGMNPGVIRAGRANMFFSPVFTEAFVNATGVPVELYAADGSVGAAIGAGIGAGVFSEREAFDGIKPLQLIEPGNAELYDELYVGWKKHLIQALGQ